MTARHGVRGDILVVLGAFVLAGLVAGVLWPHLVSPVEVVRTDSGLTTGEAALGERFDNDAWFIVLGVVLGLPLGAVMTLWRRADELVTVGAVVVGAGVASWMTSALGRSLGPDDPAVVLADAAAGTTTQGMVSVAAEGAYLAWPVAALTGALLVLWGTHPRSVASTPRHRDPWSN